MQNSLLSCICFLIFLSFTFLFSIFLFCGRNLFELVSAVADIPVKRKIEKNRERVLHHESLLQKNVFVKPVPSSILKKRKKKKEKIVPKPTNEPQNTPNVCSLKAFGKILFLLIIVV